MPELQKPTDRLNYAGELEPVVDRLCAAYGVGTPSNFDIVEVGYEDCNVVLETDQDKYLAKMFAKTRTSKDIARYTTTMQKVVAAGVHHPELLITGSGEATYTDSGITLVLMRFVEGKTFFELDRAPDTEERKAVLEQAAKVNEIDYKPPYLFDSWAIPNIRAMFDKVRGNVSWQVFIEPKGNQLLELDAWKEKFLLQIKDRFKTATLLEDDNYRVVGLPFYNEAHTKEQFVQALVQLG